MMHGVEILHILPWTCGFIVSALKHVPAKDAYRHDGWGNWASSYSSARHARWSTIYSEIFTRWQEPIRSKRRVVAVLTTTPKRIGDIQVVLDSLLHQSYKADAIYVFVPHIFRRDNTKYVIPSWLDSYHADGKVSLVRCDDRGPGTDVLTALEMEQDPNTFIFKVDDDQVYGKNTLNLLVRSGTSIMPGRAISADSTQYYPHVHGVILQGVHGMIFQRKLFDDTIFDYSISGNFSKHCWLHDDLWYSMHFAKKGIRRESLEMRLETRALDNAWSPNALFQGGAGTDNYQNLYLCNAAVLRVHPHLWEPRYHVALIITNDFQSTPGNSFHDLFVRIALQTKLPHNVHAFGFSGAEYVGGWMDGFSIIPHDWEECGKCDSEGLVQAISEVEEESETVLILAKKHSLEWPRLVEDGIACATKYTLVDHAPNCEFHGAWAIWRGSVGTGSFLVNITDPIFDQPMKPGQPPSVSLEPIVDLFPDDAYLWEVHEIQQWRDSIEHPDGGSFSFVIVVHATLHEAPISERTMDMLLRGSLPPDVLYLCLHTQPGQQVVDHHASDPRVNIIEGRSRLDCLEHVCQQECPRAFILSLGVQVVVSTLFQLFLSLAFMNSGHAIGTRAIRYRSVGPILVGTTLFPPGALDMHLAREGREKCDGAEDLWLWFNLAGRGVRALAMKPHLANKVVQALGSQGLTEVDFTQDDTWRMCFDFLWSKLGSNWLRFGSGNLQPQRIALFVRPLPASLLSVLASEHRSDFAKHCANLDLRYLLDQTKRPGVVYILDDGALHGHTSRWHGGVDGFDVRLLRCGQCTHQEQFMVAMGVEWHPETLFIFVTAERLLSDQLVLENMRCAQKMLSASMGSLKYCGYNMHSMGNRLMEMALLRGQFEAQSQ